MHTTAAIITGARREFTPFILDSARRILGPDESPRLIFQPYAEEALAHEDRFMPPAEQYAIRDILRTKAQLAWRDGVRRCLIVGFVLCDRVAQRFEECTHLVKRELYEVDEWHIFEDLSIACLTPAPEMVLL